MGEVLHDPSRLAALEAVLPSALANRVAMDRLAELAAIVMDAPVAMVSLIDDRYQHLVGLFGSVGACAAGRRAPIDFGYCPDTTMVSGLPVYLEDAADDPAFAGHAAHLEAGFVAYAAVPLRDADGQLLGTFCVVDTEAHRWRRVDRRALEVLSGAVVSEIALHRDVDRRRRLLDAFGTAPAMIAVTRGPEHIVEYLNAAYRSVFGELDLDRPARDAMPDLPAEYFALMNRVLATGETYSATDAPVTLVWPGEQQPRERFFDLSYSPIGRGDPAASDRRRGLLIVAVEVTERVHAHRALQRDARHQQLLTRASAALNSNLDPAAELRSLARVAVPELADAAMVHLLTTPVAPGTEPRLPVITDRVAVAVAPGGPGSPEIAAGLRWEGDGDPVTETIRRGGMLRHPIAVPSPSSWPPGAEQSGIGHVVGAPVIVDGMVVAVVLFGMRHGRPLWEPDELSTLGEIARHAGVAVGHGLSYQRTRDTALILQRSLLTEPPHIEGLEICARYRPAGRDEVGGDWYDAFERRPDQLALVIGDVLGHDITAAAAMAQLRAVLRGLALDRSGGPAAALDRLDAINGRLAMTAFATLVHAHLTRPASGAVDWGLRWAAAGHPPPLLLAPGAAARILDLTTGAALTRAETGPRTEAEVAVAPGSTLLLYTDGLIERRGTDLADNLTEVAEAAARTVGRPLEDFCDGLLHEAPSSDDVALLAIRVL